MIGVQATSVGNIQSRVKKLVELETVRRWLLGDGRRVQVWGWGQYSVRRGGPKRWQVRIIEILSSPDGSLIVSEESKVVSLDER